MDKKVIEQFALENAVKYGGKANVGAVIGKIFSVSKDINKDKVINEVKKIVKDVNKLNLKEQYEKLKLYGLPKKKKKKKDILPELSNVKGKVVMRLAPYPSGPLHIGNARTFLLNDYYCKRYKGKLYLIIDDTIGSKEKRIVKEAYKLIPESLKWLGIKYDKVLYKSDRLKIYYKYAEELIKKGKAYVCSCNPTKLRENRKKKIECKCRKKNIKENLKDWKKMFKSKQGSMTLRIKTSMQHKNPAFRDRVLFRISNRTHPKVGKKYRVWPLLEFSWAIDDHLLSITHVLRGKELRMESEMEKFIWDILGWKYVNFIYNGLMQIEGVKISKSKAQKEILSKKYIGWDDPRTWSLQSLKRRGFKPEAIRNFIYGLGLSETEITVNIESLYHENKKIIDKEANRYFVIFNKKKIKIKDVPIVSTKAPLHPEVNRGNRLFKIGKEFYIQDKLEKNKNYRFMHLFNFKNNKFISLDLDDKLKAKLIHWLPASKDLVNIEVLMEDGKVMKGIGESNLKNVKLGEVIQAERNFFMKLDKKEKNKLVFWYTHK